MGLPVDSLDLQSSSFNGDKDALEKFLRNAAHLYRISFTSSAVLKPRTIDALIDKYLPVDGGSFIVKNDRSLVSQEQLEKLVLKCEMSNKKVNITVNTIFGLNVEEFFDFDKYYSKKRAEDGVICAVRDGARLEVRVKLVTHIYLVWEWVELDLCGTT
uniref:Nicotinate phosphoribosyltransferase n=1 Tax=Steinernema glaseri TaxID=37863 RepID=A0A1I7ZSE5_9BILA